MVSEYFEFGNNRRVVLMFMLTDPPFKQSEKVLLFSENPVPCPLFERTVRSIEGSQRSYTCSESMGGNLQRPSTQYRCSRTVSITFQANALVMFVASQKTTLSMEPCTQHMLWSRVSIAQATNLGST